MDAMDESATDICRVCRAEAAPDKPLFHPCVCTGSIRYIHQECLLQWLKYSKKEYCELCKHRFAFTPIYSPDMPKRLPIQVLLGGLVKSVGHAVRYWFHYTLVAFAWLGVVPLTTCRIYRCLFTGTWSSLLTLPIDILSTDNLIQDCFQGCSVVTCTLGAFISLVWLREQIVHGGGPDWLDFDFGGGQQNPAAPAPAAAAPVADAGNIAEDEREGMDMVEPEVVPDVPPVNPEPQIPPAPPVQDDNWNPIEWDRGAEELTWERLLGLDGSLVFLEHVFWVVSLNTLFILVFAFCPYYLGHFILVGMKYTDLTSTTKFEGLLTTLLGYTVIAITLITMHSLSSVGSIRRWVTRSHRILGLCYVVVKVVLLVVIEIGVFPLICGWWLDICSLSMFDATIRDREASFKVAPTTSMFIHWLVGMVYVFYFASFILLLREVLRPGVLWFLRNLNEPDFNPIQEMIHLPVYKHVRRFLVSMVIFGTTVLVMLWLPIKFIRTFFGGFLPYNVMLSSDSPMSELSLELLLLQVVLPALLEQGYTRLWLKNLVRYWCIAVSMLLDLRSYLLGDEPLHKATQTVNEGEGAAQIQVNNIAGVEQEQNEEALGVELDGAVIVEPNIQAAEEVGVNRVEVENQGGNADYEQPQDWNPQNEQNDNVQNEIIEHMVEHIQGLPANAQAPIIPPREPAPVEGLGAAHHAILQRAGPTGFQPYTKPNLFHARLFCLCALCCITLFVASLVTLIIPVFIGRLLMSIWMGDSRIHELYTAACGLYTCWVTLRASTVIYNWVPQGWAVIFGRVSEWTILALKSLLIATLMIGVVPLLLGLLFELVIVAPIRVPLNQTPIFFPWQDWALGVLHAKIICATSMLGPQWWLRRVIEQVYNQGLRNMDLVFILTNLCVPVISVLALSLAVPYIIAKSIVPALGCTFDVQVLVLRRIYPSLLGSICLIAFCIFQARQFKRLYEHIKNDRYLVGQKLVNYDKRHLLAVNPIVNPIPLGADVPAQPGAAEVPPQPEGAEVPAQPEAAEVPAQPEAAEVVPQPEAVEVL